MLESSVSVCNVSKTITFGCVNLRQTVTVFLYQNHSSRYMYTMNEATIYNKRGSYAINILGLLLFQYALAQYTVTDSIICLANTGTD